MYATSNAMAKEFKLPMVPGASCGEEMMRRNYHKSQVFGAKSDKTTKTQAPVQDQTMRNLTLTQSNAGTGASQPTSPSKSGDQGNAAALTGRVLRFFAYLMEPVAESAVERERVRRVVLCYYLEDGTIAISEPRNDNSGFAFQGTLVKRHVIPTSDGSPVQLDQLSVGGTVTLYSRTYNVVDADQFTRDFYNGLGVTLSPALDYPRDNYSDLRARPQKVHSVPSIAATSTLNISLSANQIRATQQFLAHDRNVLRCDCTWDDSKALNGDIHYLTLYYFLCDDCIAVVEKEGVNTGRDPFPNFVRRQKIPKPSQVTGKFENINSSLTFQSKDEGNANFYTEADIRIGNKLNIFGREVLICDYDKNTRDVLRERFGYTEYKPIDTTVPPKPVVTRQLPPYNGFGEEEDSRGSCMRLDVKPPRKDGTRFAKFGGNGVKYVLKLENGVATDDIRRFVLTCFLADDTLCIYEPVQRNSGIVGGKFLQRQKLKKPDETPFVAKDFFVGCHVVLNGFPFVCIATDERSLSFMEQHSSDFEHSNVNHALQKVQAMLISNTSGLFDALLAADKTAKGTLDLQEMLTIFTRLQLPLSEQELLTVLRYFDRNGESSISYEDLVSRVMPEGFVVNQDPRDWQEIFDEMSNESYSKLSVADKVKLQKDRLQATTAAYAARAFLEQYNARRALFQSEFRFIVDYAQDSLVGEREFRMCCRDKLKVQLTDVQLDALCEKFFPANARRVTIEELMRLFNGTSNLPHNMNQLKIRRM